MLDPKRFRQKLSDTATKLAQRDFKLDVASIINLEEKRRILQVEVQELQNERNQRSKEIGLAKAKSKNVDAVIAGVHSVGEKLDIKNRELEKLLNALNAIYAGIPNIPHESVPKGLNEENNVEVSRFGEPKKFDFVPKDHVKLGAALGMMDFASAAKITGSRFVILSSKIAKLQRALIQFMLDLHTKKHGYQELYVPHLVNNDSLFGTGQLPKFGEDLFKIEGEFKYSLIPTAEVSITNLLRDEIVSSEKLPLKYVAHTPCYRSEAGSYGKDMQGMIRQHQFEKVELVRIELPENSYNALEKLREHAERVLQKLELPYRVVSLCAGDLGFASAKTYDLEVWLPSQNKYREISSCSNFEDFQARRMKARFREDKVKNTEFLHTLNGSGLAVGRAMVAILENFQDQAGHIHLPKVLWDYMDGEKVIKNI